MPELLHLDPRAQPLQQQHLHWGFDRLRPRETLGLRGKSSLDREQGGLKPVDFFRLDALSASLADDGGTELTDAARLQRRFVGCLKMMREGHAACLKLANIEDATWRGKLVCVTLAELFLRRLPLPLPPKESGGCTWAASRRPDPLDDACVVAAVLEQCQQLMQMLAFGSASLMGDDAEQWHPSLVCIGGAIAAIADAVARRGASDGSAPILAQLLQGLQGHLVGAPSAEEGGSGQRPYGIGVGAFQARTETLLIGRPELCIVRKHVLEYFHGLALPVYNELFDVEDPAHYQGVACATLRLFKALAREHYSYAAVVVCDVNHALRRMGGGVESWRDVMMWWKVFTCACSERRPFCSQLDGARPTLPEELELRWRVLKPDSSSDGVLCPYKLVLQLLQQEGSEETGDEVTMLLGEDAKMPVLGLERTETHPTFYTLPHLVATEDDVLHLRQLPDFDGHLRPSRAELLLQYLTVPYLRIPLVLDFFDADTIYSLQSEQLRALLERVLFEPGAFLAKASPSERLEPPEEVPSSDPRTTATQHGLLLMELVQSGPRLIEATSRLLSLALTFDAYRPDDPMADVIMFIARLAVRLEASAAYLLSGAAARDADSLTPQDGPTLFSALGKLSELLQHSLQPCLLAWLAVAEADEREGSEPTRVRSAVHEHLVLLHANVQVVSAAVVQRILVSFMYVMSHHNSSSVHQVTLIELFGIIHSWRSRLIGWLEAGTRTGVEVCQLLDAVYAASTGRHVECRWGRLKEPHNRARYAVLRPREDSAGGGGGGGRQVENVREDDENMVAELNLQLMQVGAAGGAIRPLPAKFSNDPDVQMLLSASGTLQASVMDVCTHYSRYFVVAHGVCLEVWDGEDVAPEVEKLNEKGREKQKKKFEGGDVGDEDELNEEDRKWLVRAGGLVRNERSTAYKRKLTAPSSLSKYGFSGGGFAGFGKGKGDKGKPGEKLEGNEKLEAHEQWVAEVMDAAGLLPLGWLGPRFRADKGEQDDTSADHKGKLQEVTYYLPDDIAVDAPAVLLIGGAETTTKLNVENPAGFDRYTPPVRYTPRFVEIRFEALAFRSGLVHVYQVQS